MKKSIVLGFVTALLSACSHPLQQGYTPGLGEFMTQLSYRHGKLWFAGQAQNWQLAAYELDEIKEGLGDIGRFHPSHHDVKTIPVQIQQYMTKPIEQTDAAIQAKNGPAFTAGYDTLTAGCNACHQANGFGFNILVKPTHNPYANQQFEQNTH